MEYKDHSFWPERNFTNKDSLSAPVMLSLSSMRSGWPHNQSITLLKRQAAASRLSFGRRSWLELVMARRYGQAAANRDAMTLAALASFIVLDERFLIFALISPDLDAECLKTSQR